MNFKNLKVLVKDYGLFLPIAQRLAEEFGEVLYFTDWKSTFSLPDKAHIGYGIKGITRVENFFDAIDDVDLIVFPDVGDADLQGFLRSKGYKVFGSGRGEVLELDRVFFRDVLTKLNMPVAPYKVVTGVDALREELKKTKDKYIKISLYRGVMESFHHKDYKFSMAEIDRIAHKLGALETEIEFIIEDPIDSIIEAGCEWMFTDTGFLPRGMWGYEIKNNGYVGKICVYADLPRPLKYVNDKFAPVFKKYGVRGQLSTEVRVNKKGEAYFIDPCQRYGSPPGEVLSEAYENNAEIHWNVAQGSGVVPKARYKYFAEIILKSSVVSTETMPIDVPEKFKKNIKLRYLCRIKNQDYYIPQGGEIIIGAACGWGSTLKEAQDMALKAADSVDGADVYYQKDVFESAAEQIQKGKSIMGFF